MNTEVLIDAIVRQTTVLIAQLATATGVRTPLSHTANQVFVDLVRELKAQGMTHAVIADMFGLALRTYHKRMQRLSESETFRGQSLWTAVLKHVQENGPTLRADLLVRFRHDDDATLRGVLNDMVEGGVLYTSGTGDRTLYRALDESELPERWSGDPERLAHMLWVAVYRFGPLDLEALEKIVPGAPAARAVALEQLVRDGRITRDDCGNYGSASCFIPVGSSQGWEASVFDHYQAVVTAICRKLELRGEKSPIAEQVGGSTYRFTVWPGHPHQEEVSSLLGELRARIVQLRERVERYNAVHDAPEKDSYQQFVAYVGTTRLGDEHESSTPRD